MIKNQIYDHENLNDRFANLMKLKNFITLFKFSYIFSFLNKYADVKLYKNFFIRDENIIIIGWLYM